MAEVKKMEPKRELPEQHKPISQMTDEEYIAHYNKNAKVRDRVRKHIPSIADQWDEKVAGRVAEDQWRRYGEPKGYPLESYELDDAAREKAAKAEHDRPETTARQDNTRVNPHVGRRRGINGEDLGEYRMK